jgi:hypothetical protein
MVEAETRTDLVVTAEEAVVVDLKAGDSRSQTFPMDAAGRCDSSLLLALISQSSLPLASLTGFVTWKWHPDRPSYGWLGLVRGRYSVAILMKSWHVRQTSGLDPYCGGI